MRIYALLTVFFLAFAAAPSTLLAQYVGLSTDPASLILGFPNLSVEVPVGPQFSLVANGSFVAGYNALDTKEDRIGGSQLSLRGRYFLRQDGEQRGFFPMAYLRYRSNRLSSDGEDQDLFFFDFNDGYDFTVNSTSGGIGLGYLHETKAGLTFSAELGIGRTFTTKARNNGPQNSFGTLYVEAFSDEQRVDGVVNVSIGWRFRRK